MFSGRLKTYIIIIVFSYNCPSLFSLFVTTPNLRSQNRIPSTCAFSSCRGRALHKNVNSGNQVITFANCMYKRFVLYVVEWNVRRK
jgi:hypothetical protein